MITHILSIVVLLLGATVSEANEFNDCHTSIGSLANSIQRSSDASRILGQWSIVEGDKGFLNSFEVRDSGGSYQVRAMGVTVSSVEVCTSNQYPGYYKVRASTVLGVRTLFVNIVNSSEMRVAHLTRGWESPGIYRRGSVTGSVERSTSSERGVL